MNDLGKPTFAVAVKKASLFLFVFILFKVVYQVIMQRGATFHWITQIIHTKESGLIVFTMLLTACISWILSSFLLGSLYFLYQTIRYRKKKST